MTYRFRGEKYPTEASRASILEPIIEGTTADLYLYDPIDSYGGYWGVSAKEFATALAALPNDTTEIHLHLNCPGGEVWDAWAIVNLLKRHKARVVAYVDGIAASAGSLLAVEATETVMGFGAQLMIHDAWNIAIGNEESFRAQADLLAKDSDAIAAAYARKAGGDVDAWRALMRAETWYSAEEAVAAGLADRAEESESGSTSKASLSDLSLFRYAGRDHAPAPQRIARAAASLKPPSSSEPVESNHQKENAMSDALKKGLRDRLGITASADELTDELLLAAVDEALNERAEETPTNKAPEGTVLLDEGKYQALQADAAAGRAARDEQVRAQRAALVESAIKDGKVPPARRDHWIAALNADEEGASAALAALAPGLIPTESLGHSVEVESAEDSAYSSIYPSKEA